MSAEVLYPLVTEAIRRAETLEDLGAPGASSAFLDVSLLEEKITEALPASHPEGALARRGAVRAALSARDLGRARLLVERFLAEGDLDSELEDALQELATQAERSTAARFPRVAARYGLSEVRRLAQVFAQQGAPVRALTLHMGPEKVLQAVDAQFREALSADEVARAVDRLERRIRESHPEVLYIFIEAEALAAKGRGGPQPPAAPCRIARPLRRDLFPGGQDCRSS